MVWSFVRLAAAAAFCALVAGCAEAPSVDYGDAGRDGAVTAPGSPLQCVPYARDHSQVALYGDAYTWWDQAAGRYARGASPQVGAVMVLNGYAGPDRGHVAVVRDILDARDIRVDHANWLNDGAVYLGDPVRDVSSDNDWSQVRVYNLKADAWGDRIYSVQGFIGPGTPDAVYLAQNPPVVQSPPAAPRDDIGALIAADPGLPDEDN